MNRSGAPKRKTVNGQFVCMEYPRAILIIENAKNCKQQQIPIKVKPQRIGSIIELYFTHRFSD